MTVLEAGGAKPPRFAFNYCRFSQLSVGLTEEIASAESRTDRMWKVTHKSVTMGEGGFNPHPIPDSQDDNSDRLNDLRLVSLEQRTGDNEYSLRWVELHGEVYSFDNLPNKDSTLVEICVNNFQENGLSDIGGLAEPFKEVCSNLEFAYYTAAANGMIQLETMIEGACFDVIKLCGKTSNTLVKFSRTSRDACIHFKGAFLYLLDGLEDIAHSKLETLAKGMSGLGASAELKELIDKCNDNVIKILEWMAGEKAKLGIAGEERMACEAGILAAKRDYGDAEEGLAAENQSIACMEKGRMFREGVETGLQALGAIAQGVLTFALPIPVKVVATAAVTVLNAAQRFVKSTDDTKDKIQLARRRVADLEKERLEANKRRNEQADRLERARGKEEVLTRLQPLLHKLVGSLKIVRQKLLRACEFWERLQTVVAPEMDTQQIQASVNALPPTKEERVAFWQSKAFAEDAISLYARWVARKIVCDQSRVGVDEANKMLDQLAVANPTQNEARAWLKQQAGGQRME